MKRELLKSVEWLVHSAIYGSIVILLLIYGVKGQAGHGDARYSNLSTRDRVSHNHFSSNDFDFTKGSGREENFRHAYTFAFKTENILRYTVYDFYHSHFFAQQLTFYTDSPYLNSLSPLWNPSIPIAHRKLLI